MRSANDGTYKRSSEQGKPSGLSKYHNVMLFPAGVRPGRGRRCQRVGARVAPRRDSRHSFVPHTPLFASEFALESLVKFFGTYFVPAPRGAEDYFRPRSSGGAPPRGLRWHPPEGAARAGGRSAPGGAAVRPPLHVHREERSARLDGCAHRFACLRSVLVVRFLVFILCLFCVRGCVVVRVCLLFYMCRLCFRVRFLVLCVCCTHCVLVIIFQRERGSSHLRARVCVETGSTSGRWRRRGRRRSAEQKNITRASNEHPRK